MSEMTQTPQHAKPSARRDHLWVLAVIAGFALFDVWESWTQVGDKSGFAHGTGWTLTVIVEAYACYALFAWFGAPGVRSRRFAMWSALAVGILSLVGQGSSVLAARSLPPLWVAVFVKDLPVVVLALIAVLIHLRQRDRAEVEEAAWVHAEAEQEARRVSADAARIAELEDAVSALTGELSDATGAHADAERRESDALTRALAAEKKLATKTARGKRPQPAQGTGRKRPRDEDLTTEMRALTLLEEKPELRKPGMGSELGRQLGLSPQTGRRLHNKLAAQNRPAGPPVSTAKAAPIGGEGD